MGPLNTFDSDVPPEYQTNSGPFASTRGRIFAVCCEHISGLKIKHGWYGISNGKARAFPPGKHYVGVGVACAGARRAPLDSVDLFTVSLEVMDAGLLLHTPDLHVKAPGRHAEA